MLINVKKSTGELLATGGASYYGQSRPADTVPVRSSAAVQVCFYDDNGNPALLNPATGTLTFTGQPTVGDTFTVGATVYTAMGSLPTSPNEFFIASTLAGTIANLDRRGQRFDHDSRDCRARPTGSGTVQNYAGGRDSRPQSDRRSCFLAWQADASGNTVATTTTSAHASFGGATLSGADILNLDIKPTGEYDANFTFVTPTFTAPANPANGCYTGTLTTSSSAGNTLLDPNNPGGGTSAAIEPDAVTLMAQLRWGPASATLPARSNKWSINLTNSVGNGAEGVTVDPPSLTLGAVETAVAQAGKAAAQWPYAYANYRRDGRRGGRSGDCGGRSLAGHVRTSSASTSPPPRRRCSRATRRALSRGRPTSRAGIPPTRTAPAATRGCVTMVTPTEGLTNNHFVQPYAGRACEHVFLGTDGALYTLTVATSESRSVRRTFSVVTFS